MRPLAVWYHMGGLNIQRLLDPVSPQDPCGPDLSNSFEYAELMQLVQDRGELTAGGDLPAAQAAERSRWEGVSRRCTELLGRGKDVWLVVYLTLAQIKTRGLPGLCDGLELLAGLLQRYWEPLHPQRDPEDDYPIQRVNAVSELSSHAFLAALRSAPAFGNCRVRDVLIIREALPGATEPAIGDETTLRNSLNTFHVQTPSEFEEWRAALAKSIQLTEQIEATITEKVGRNPVQLQDLRTHLTVVLGFIEGTSNEPAGQTRPGSPQPANGNGMHEINSRDEVIQAIERIIGYYKRNDPASPVPLLLHRAKRLVPMDFMQIIQDMAPDAMDTVRRLTGEEQPALST